MLEQQIEKKEMKFYRCVIMCAGSGKRYRKPYPKQTEIIEGMENYKRTIKLFNDEGVNDIYISVSDENSSFFDYPNKIIGSNKREIDRFRNLRKFIEDKTLILYGDVIYAQIDVKKILSSTVIKNDGIIFFGRDSENKLTKKTYGEIFAVFVFDKNKFFKAVDCVAEKFEKGIINREIAWDVKKELGINNLVRVSNYTDDFDTVQELFKFKKYVLNSFSYQKAKTWDRLLNIITNLRYQLFIYIKSKIRK